MTEDDLERRLRAVLRAVDRAAGEPRHPDPPPARSSRARRASAPRTLVAAVLAVVVAVGVGALVVRRADDDQGIRVGGPDDLYRGVALFVSSDGAVRVCPDGKELTVSPGCPAVFVPVDGVDASTLPDEGAYLRFTARLSSGGLSVREYDVATEPSEPPLQRRDPGGPCAVERRARDGATQTQAELTAGMDAARQVDGFAGAWIERPGASGPEIVTDVGGELDGTTLVVGTAGDVALAADAAAGRWPGPVCVVAVPFTYDALVDVQRAAEAHECSTSFLECVVSSSIDEPGNRVRVRTLAPSEALDEVFHDAIDEGAVEVMELLRPVG